MKRRKKKQLQMMGILLALVLVVVVLIVVGVKLIKDNFGNKLESIALSANFSESELDVNKDYTFTYIANPEKAKLKDIEFITDASNASFEMTEEGTAVLHTYTEGRISVCVKCGDINSNFLSFDVVDKAAAEAARAAEAQAQLEAQAQAEAAAAAQAEAEANAGKEFYVRTIDTVRMRKSPSTDSNDNIIRKCEIGEVYRRLREVDDWSEITYDNDEAYIKTEYLEVLSDEEAAAALEAEENKAVEDALKEAEEKKLSQDEAVAAAAQAAAAQLAQAQTDANAQATVQAAADQQKALEDAAAAQAAAELAAQAAAAQTAAPAVGGLTPIQCKDGTCYVTAAQVNTIHATWDFAGDAIEMAGHHSIGELEAVIGPTQH